MGNKKTDSIIDLTNAMQKYKQEIFWKSQELKKKFDKFYEKQDEYSLYLLTDYKSLGSFEINTFLYDRKLFFSEYRKSLFLMLDNIFRGKKALENEKIKTDIINNIYFSFYRIVKSITTLDELFRRAPKLEDNMMVYRGVRFSTPKLESKMLSKLSKLKRGDNFIFENFLSTSLLNQTAIDFLESQFTNDKKPRCCLFKIKIPKNTRVIYLDTDLTGFKFLKPNKSVDDVRQILFSEYEILLPRSTLLKFEKKYAISGKVPTSCKLDDIKKGCISDIQVYEFEVKGVNPDREVFSAKKAIDPEYLKNIMKDLHHISFDVSKYDLLQYSKGKNISETLKKLELDSRKRMNRFR
jgi:hypothetical protein